MGEARRRGTLQDRINNPNFICIICREIKSYTERSDEHVIPDSLNGYYHIFNVCLRCNADMGTNVDSKLLDYKLTELYRFSEKIKGKSGKIPNPFREIHSLKDEPDQKVRADIINGEIVTKFLPYSSKPEINEDGTLTTYCLTVDATDRHLLEGMSKKIIKRNKLDDKKITNTTYVENTIENPELEGRWNVDIHNYRIGFLKIAYEFAIDNLPKYFDDHLAIKISNILQKALYDELNQIKITYGFEREVFEKFSPLIDMDKKRHLLILTSFGDGLLCFIKLDNIIHAVVKLSNYNYLNFENTIIGINDLEKHSFEKTSLNTFLNKPHNELFEKLEMKLIYDVKSSIEYSEVPSPDHALIERDEQPVLFNEFGNQLQYSLEDLCAKSSCTDQKLEEDAFLLKFIFPPSNRVFVKSSKTGKLYQVVGCENFQKYQKL